jgi:hypothetical protein
VAKRRQALEQGRVAHQASHSSENDTSVSFCAVTAVNVSILVNRERDI